MGDLKIFRQGTALARLSCVVAAENFKSLGATGPVDSFAEGPRGINSSEQENTDCYKIVLELNDDVVAVDSALAT